jgi:hypothetical protein
MSDTTGKAGGAFWEYMHCEHKPPLQSRLLQTNHSTAKAAAAQNPERKLVLG